MFASLHSRNFVSMDREAVIDGILPSDEREQIGVGLCPPPAVGDVPRRAVACDQHDRPRGKVRRLSGRNGRQVNDGFAADGRHGSQRHRTSALDGPFIILVKRDGATSRRARGTFRAVAYQAYSA